MPFLPAPGALPDWRNLGMHTSGHRRTFRPVAVDARAPGMHFAGVSKPKKAKPSDETATPGTVMAAKLRARANKLTDSERAALTAEVASVVHGAAIVAAERAIAALMANPSVKRRVKAADPKSRKQRAVRALANHPRAAQILGSVDFRDPTPRELQTAASLKDRARSVRARHAAAA